MRKLSKRARAFEDRVDRGRHYSVDEAVEILEELSSNKFKESYDISINLGVDPKKSDQVVRGATVLPNGTGKSVRVAVFAQGDKASEAKDAGADIVGMEDLAEAVKNGELNFDLAIATPDSMRVVGQLGQILGPRGLMPNPRLGTVTQEVTEAVSNAKAGQIMYRTDKNGIVHASIGKSSFTAEKIFKNADELLKTIIKLKPSTSKGVYVKSVYMSSTMSPGISIDTKIG